MPAPAFSDYWSLRYSAGGLLPTRRGSQYLGAACAWLAQVLGLSPSQVTLLGTAAFGVAAWAYCALPDTGVAALACLALLQLGYGLDCADGQLARATQRTSAFGAWLDLACDYVRNVLLAAAVAAWLVSRGEAALGGIAAACFAAGTAVHLHTVGALRSGASVPAAPRGPLRELLTALLDTPTVLLLIALLRPAPALLGPCVAAVGAAYLVLSVRLARARL